MDGQSSRNRGDRNNVFFGMPSPDLEREVSFIKDELQRRPVLPDVPVIEINTPALYTPPPSPTPIPLANLGAWWDFSDLAYRTLHTGTVGQTYWKWLDRSVSDMKLVVPNDTLSPNWYNNPSLTSINGIQALTFDYSSAGQYESFNIDDGGTNGTSNPSNGIFSSLNGKITTIFFFVVDLPVLTGTTGPSAGDILRVMDPSFTGTGKDRYISVYRSTQGGNLFASSGFATGDIVAGVSNLRGAGPVVVTVIFQNTTPHITIRVNGIVEASSNVTTVPAALSNSKFTVCGTSRSDDTEFGEILVYNYPLSDPEIFQVESYLATKWGIV